MTVCDTEAIKQLKARYFRFLDTKQWARWRLLFTDDAVFEGTSRPFAGPDDFCSSTAGWLGKAVTVHQGFMPEIEITGRGMARGTWAMHDLVQFQEPIVAGAYKGMTGFEGFGHYEEEYRCIDTQWKISRLRLTRLRVDPLPSSRTLSQLPEGLIKSGVGER